MRFISRLYCSAIKEERLKSPFIAIMSIPSLTRIHYPNPNAIGSQWHESQTVRGVYVFSDAWNYTSNLWKTQWFSLLFYSCLKTACFFCCLAVKCLTGHKASAIITQSINQKVLADWWAFSPGSYQSGQMGLTVNQLSSTSGVRIPHCPPVNDRPVWRSGSAQSW